jgi:hypothetical protein
MSIEGDYCDSEKHGGSYVESVLEGSGVDGTNSNP